MRVRAGRKRWAGGTFLLIALVAALAVVPAAASAKRAAAGLDRSFGKNGRAGIGFAFAGSRPEYGIPASWDNSNIDLIAGPGGSSLIAGKHQIVRLRADGKVDSSFGQSGRLTPSTLAGLAFAIESVAVDSQQRLLVFGTGEDLGVTKRLGSSELEGGGVNVHPSYAVVARYTTGGALDPSFGGGDGVAVSDLGFHPGIPVVGGGPTPSLVAVVGGGVDGQDRPLAFVHGYRLEGSKYAGTILVETAPSLVRFSADGGFETGFAGSGWVPLPQGDRLRAIATPSGSLLIVGRIFSDDGVRSYTQIIELNQDGAVDPSFGNGGSQIVVGNSAAVLDRRGRLLLLQPPREKGRQQVMRLRPNGQLDKRFGNGGRVGLRLPEKGDLGSLAVDSKGRVLVAGVGKRLLVGRLSASGAHDRGFGSDGWLRTGMGQQTRLVGPTQVLEYPGRVPSAALTGGKLVVADPAQSPKLPNGGVLLARYRLGS